MGVYSGTSIQKLTQALDKTALRQKITSQNIANIDTPGYKVKRIVFSDVLEDSMAAKRTSARHVSFEGAGAPRIVANQQSIIQNNGNNVNMEIEMNRLAKTQIRYQSYIQAVNHEFRVLGAVIKGGR